MGMPTSSVHPQGSYNCPYSPGDAVERPKPKPRQTSPHKSPGEVFSAMRQRLKTNPGTGYMRPFVPGSTTASMGRMR